MRKKLARIVIVVGSLLMFCGCQGSPMEACLASKEKLQAMSDEQLCNGYAFCKSKSIKEALEDRGTFTDEEWLMIDRGALYVGMTRKAVFATVKNVMFNGMTTTDHGTIEQWKTGSKYASLYIHLKNGKVISWSFI